MKDGGKGEIRGPHVNAFDGGKGGSSVHKMIPPSHRKAAPKGGHSKMSGGKKY